MHSNERYRYFLKILRICLISLLLVGSVVSPVLYADGSKWGDRFIEGRIEQKKREGLTYLKNKGLCDVVVFYTLTQAENCLTEPECPVTVLLKPGEEKMVLRVYQDDYEKRWFFRGRYQWRIGNPDAVHDDSATYRLPWHSGESFRVMQGFNGSVTHSGEHQYSIDFDMPEGTEICAARDGLVVDVVDTFEGYGFSDEYKNKTNAVNILHSDGTIGNYGHIQKGGARVKTGQYVKAGDLIGLSGNVGYSDCNHLHFAVYIPESPSKIKSVYILFDTSEQKGVELEQGVTYTAP